MKMLSVMGCRILVSKVIGQIHPFFQIFYLRIFIVVLANTLVRFIGFRCSENSFKNMMFLVTIGANIRMLPLRGIYALESDDVT